VNVAPGAALARATQELIRRQAPGPAGRLRSMLAENQPAVNNIAACHARRRARFTRSEQRAASATRGSAADDPTHPGTDVRGAGRILGSSSPVRSGS
jgi:hypothetical protein